MEVLPTMPEDQWQQYKLWVAGFGVSRRATRRATGRKVDKMLEYARKHPNPQKLVFSETEWEKNQIQQWRKFIDEQLKGAI